MHRALPLLRLLAVFLTLLSSSVHASEWMVDKISKPVHYTLDAEAWHALDQGMAVPDRSWVKVGPRGRLLLRRGSEMIQFKPGTVAAVISGMRNGRSTTEIRQKVGSVLLDVETRDEWHTSVETPFLTAVVKGTRFSVDVSARSARLEVERGVVEATDPSRGERVDVRGGQSVAVTEGSSRSLSVEGAGPKAPVVKVPPREPVVEPALTEREARQMERRELRRAVRVAERREIRAAERRDARRAERQAERREARIDDRRSDRASERRVDRAFERQAERQEERRQARQAESKSDKEASRRAERQAERAAERAAERKAERKAERAAERRAERKAERTVERGAERKAERQAERAAERQAERRAQRQAQRRAERRAARKAERSAEPGE